LPLWTWVRLNRIHCTDGNTRAHHGRSTECPCGHGASRAGSNVLTTARGDTTWAQRSAFLDTRTAEPDSLCTGEHEGTQRGTKGRFCAPGAGRTGFTVLTGAGGDTTGTLRAAFVRTGSGRTGFIVLTGARGVTTGAPRDAFVGTGPAEPDSLC
jgi:hypothetical protein